MRFIGDKQVETGDGRVDFLFYECPSCGIRVGFEAVWVDRRGIHNVCPGCSREFEVGEVSDASSFFGDHTCPDECVRAVEYPNGIKYLSCMDMFIEASVLEELGICKTDHIWVQLPKLLDGRLVSRCQRCGCWKY